MLYYLEFTQNLYYYWMSLTVILIYLSMILTKKQKNCAFYSIRIIYFKRNQLVVGRFQNFGWQCFFLNMLKRIFQKGARTYLIKNFLTQTRWEWRKKLLWKIKFSGMNQDGYAELATTPPTLATVTIIRYAFY